MKRVKNFNNFDDYMNEKTSLFVVERYDIVEFKIVDKFNENYWEAEIVGEESNFDLDLYINLDWLKDNIVIEPETTTLSEIKEFISKEISNPMMVLFSKTFKNYIKDETN